MQVVKLWWHRIFVLGPAEEPIAPSQSSEAGQADDRTLSAVMDKLDRLENRIKTMEKIFVKIKDIAKEKNLTDIVNLCNQTGIFE